MSKYKRVCINREGISVFDDVDGLSGFADLLGTIYEGEKKRYLALVHGQRVLAGKQAQGRFVCRILIW